MSTLLRIATIGFTQRSAAEFFGALQAAGVSRLIDIRRNTSSQLSGFAKSRDLAYFCTLHGIAYEQVLEFAPSESLLGDYKQGKTDWAGYENRFACELARATTGYPLDAARFDGSCLMCAEPTPDQCHRRLVGEWLADSFTRAGRDVRLMHIVKP